MKTSVLHTALLLAALLFAFDVAADQYDPADDVVGGNSSLRQGHPPITRDLVAVGGVADVDWFKVMTGPYSSYEVAVSYIHPNISIAWNLERFDNAGTTLQQGYGSWFSTDGTSFYFRVRTLRWQTTTLVQPEATPAIKVTGDATNTAAYPYTIQFRETTLYCPRFNNAGSQVTVLLMQSSIQGDFTCDYSVHFFNPAGGLLATQTGTFTELPSGFSPMLVLNTSAVPGLAGLGGNARIAHTCGLGGITAKLVALEPSSGFSFDTPCSNKEQ